MTIERSQGIAAMAKDSHPNLGPLAGSQNTVGNIFYGSKGFLAIDSNGGFKSWMGKDEEPGPSVTANPEDDHFGNVINCVMTRKKEELRAPIEEGHVSCALVHLANVSYRLGRTLYFDPETHW